MSSMGRKSKKILIDERRVMSILSNNLLSVSQVAKNLGIRKDVANRLLEDLRNKGKLEAYIIGKSKVYTLPKEQLKPPKNRVIGIVSGKGGVGKTTVALNLATSLLDFTKNVIVIDADTKMSGLSLQLGVHYVPATLNDVLRGNMDIVDALYLHSTGLRIVPASLAVENVDTSPLNETLQTPNLRNNLILVDSPPGLEESSINVLRACNEIVVVVNPELPSIADAIKVVDAARQMGVSPLGVVVNMYKKGEKNQINLKEIERALELPILGVIPENRKIKKSIYKRVPFVSLYPNSNSSVEFKKIAAKILNVSYKPPNPFVMALKNLLGFK